MLDWKIIKGINNKMNYYGNVENGVELPELNEEVLFCRTNYADDKKDIYFAGYIYSGDYGLELVNPIVGGVEMLTDGVKWARFNKPETDNNIGYAIAYIDENGNNFVQDVPNIIAVEKDQIETNIEKLTKMGCSDITVFKYINPCTYAYNWEYVLEHKIEI